MGPYQAAQPASIGGGDPGRAVDVALHPEIEPTILCFK